MSLLDDVSIVVTPNGYKAGELYAVVPVPTEGAEEVTNGDFATDLSGWSTLGTNATNTITWESNGARIISTGVNISILQTNILTIGKTYRLTCDVAITVGKIGLDGATSGSTVNMVEGFNEIIFTAISTTFKIKRITGNDNCLLDNVSVKEYTAADMDVTRATAATRVDEDGLVNYAEVLGDSVLTGNNSNFDTGIGSWVTYNGGTLAHSTDKLEVTLTSGESGARIDTNSLISGGQSGKTFKVRARIWQGTTTATALKIFIGGVQVNITISSTPTYFEFELTPTSTAMLTIYRAGGLGGVGTYFIDDVTVKEVTRDNVPRIDYTGGGCPHILAEPQRTNLIPFSEDLTEWNKGNLTISPNAIVSPDGTQNADTLNVIDDNDFIYEGATTTASTEYVFSFYVKRGTIAESSLKLAVYDDTNNAFIVNSSYSASDSEWTRVTQSFTTPVGCIKIRAYAFRNSSTTLGTFSVWGAQVEESYATSYIPTSGSTVTRNQDIFTRDGIGSLINSTEGVLFVEFKTLSETGTFRQFNLSKNSDNRIYITKRADSGNLEFRMENPAGTLNFSFAKNTTNDFVKVAFRYGLNNFAVFIDGVNQNVTPTGNVFASGTLNTLEFDSPLGQPFFGKVKQLQVYKTALTDAQLTSLTT